jgi:hypothetical protein
VLHKLEQNDDVLRLQPKMRADPIKKSGCSSISPDKNKARFPFRPPGLAHAVNCPAPISLNLHENGLVRVGNGHPHTVFMGDLTARNARKREAPLAVNEPG